MGEKWEDYNVRTNVSIAQLLRWVSEWEGPGGRQGNMCPLVYVFHLYHL